jgi:hypothetical protein
MSFYSDASLALIPSGYKNGKVYSALPTDGSGDLSFTRASNATRVASNGLIEKVRTNLILQSNTLNTTWTTPNVSVTSGQTDPDGGLTAWLITETTDGGSLRQAVTATGSLTFSFTLKANTGSTSATLFCTDASQQASFDLSAGTFSESGATGKMVSLGNGWWRCSISFTASGASTLILFPSSGLAVGSTFAYEAQLETGDIATDYIPTTTTAVSVGPVSGLPRLDYLNSSCPRLLLEPQRTNQALFSEQFDNSNWTKLDTAATANAATSPDGYTNADKIVPNTTSTRHILFQSFTASAVHTFSVFAKAAGQNFLTMRLDDDTPEINVYFNLSTGTIGSTAGGSPTMTSYGNGWYRCTVTYTPSGTETIYAVLGSANQNGVQAYAGNNTDGILLYGAQLEAGAYATSYIPTLGTSVTRVADAASKTSATALIGQTEGTLFVDFEINSPDSGASKWIFFLKGSGGAYMGFYTNGADKFIVEVNNAGEQFFNNSVSVVLGKRFKMALAYKQNDFAFYVDGVQIAIDNSGTVPTCSSLEYLYNTTASNIGSLEHNQTLVFKTRLSNESLASLTTL